MRTMRATLTVFLALLALAPQAAEGQYFGRNKVQYDDFDFRVIETDHFDIHYYEEMAGAVDDLSRMSERWYERFARTFQHEFEQSKPLIFYADHPDFQQTNTLQGFIGEGTGGVTESLKNRVIMPMTGSYWDTDHVLGHEMVHAFQYNIAQSRRGGGLQGLYGLPLWLIEGMAEYLSVGRDDPLTAMWMRDAIRRDDFPTIMQMTRESRFFPYRFGQALWAYIGGTYGDDAVVNTFRRSLRIGFGGAIQQVLGVSPDTLSAQWAESVREAYTPLMEGRDAPETLGEVRISPENAGKQSVSPAISPDGRFMAFLSEKDLFSVDLYLAEVQTGRIIRKLSNSIADPHSDALRYIDSSGTFSPDGERFAYVVFAGGDNEIVIVETRNGKVRDRIEFDGIGAISNPAWSPDGRYIAFSGMVGGMSDLYLHDLEAEETIALTNDKFADFHPVWSPDGSTLAFASDRGPETDWETLVYSKFQITTLDVRTRAIRVLPLMGNVRHSNPQYSPDGRSIYFLSDADGFSDLYRTDLATGDIFRVTQVATGVSGIVPMSPALAVAEQSGNIIVSLFSEFGFTIHELPANSRGTALRRVADAEAVLPPVGRALPPGEPRRFNLVAEYLADAETGLYGSGSFADAESRSYKPSLALDFVGQPTIGVGADNFGSYLGGGASAYFSDMLGNNVLGVAVQANGTVKDIGGSAFYTDLGNRWNWAVGASHVPFQYLLGGYREEEGGDLTYVTQRFRIFQSSASAQVAYPFSMTRRIEAGVGFTRFAYDVEEDVLFLDPLLRPFALDRRQRPDLEAPALNLGQVSLGLVGDYSFQGFVSPIRGGRYRFEVEATVGSESFITATADWRKYISPTQNLTFGIRGLHIGRYGINDLQVEQDGGLISPVRPFFIGFEPLIRGYAFNSFTQAECGESLAQLGAGQIADPSQFASCPTYDRLFGQRIAIMNLEARIPLLGFEQYGIINFPYLPTELVGFIDGGLAWDENRPATLEWSTSSAERVPVFSAGISARTNILGFLILESYYAFPFQRPERGWHWGFNLAPGW